MELQYTREISKFLSLEKPNSIKDHLQMSNALDANISGKVYNYNSKVMEQIFIK